MANRRLDDLDPEFRPKVVELLARLVEADVPVKIICTRRTVEEQREMVERRVSMTMHSKHIAGRAIDIVPLAVLRDLGWNPNHPHWVVIGRIARMLGLDWGGDWHTFVDKPHIEMPD